MLVGHTKFSPDAYFGLLKKKYRRSRTYTYRQLIDIINTSTVKECNVCHPYRDDDGSASFRYRAWTKWLEKYFRKLPGISNYHHFSMDSSNPGVVTARRYVDSEQETFELLKKTADYSALLDGSILPKEVTPAGLSPQNVSGTCTTRFGNTYPIQRTRTRQLLSQLLRVLLRSRIVARHQTTQHCQLGLL